MSVASAISDGVGSDDRHWRAGYAQAVQDYIGEIPSTEIIGVLETAKACVISQAIKELRGEE